MPAVANWSRGRTGEQEGRDLCLQGGGWGKDRSEGEGRSPAHLPVLGREPRVAGRESLARIQNPGGQKPWAAWVRSSEEAGVSTHLLQAPLTASFHLPGQEVDMGKGRDPLSHSLSIKL